METERGGGPREPCKRDSGARLFGKVNWRLRSTRMGEQDSARVTIQVIFAHRYPSFSFFIPLSPRSGYFPSCLIRAFCCRNMILFCFSSISSPFFFFFFFFALGSPRDCKARLSCVGDRDPVGLPFYCIFASTHQLKTCNLMLSLFLLISFATTRPSLKSELCEMESERPDPKIGPGVTRESKASSQLVKMRGVHCTYPYV